MHHNAWQHVTPDSVMNIVESVLGERLTNVCIPRNSYINRVFELELQNRERLIVKFYRPGRWTSAMIEGEHAFLQLCMEHDLPVIPPLTIDNKTVFMCGDSPFALFPKKGGRAIDELSEALWKETGRLLGRVHNVGATIKKSDRVIWRPAMATKTHLDTLLHADVVPLDYHAVLNNAVTQFIAMKDPLFDNVPMSLIHGDTHFGNIIYRPGEHLYIVDFDDCVVGPAVQDVWMLLPGTAEECPQELAWFKEGYTTFRDFPGSTMTLLPALRIMRQIHFAAWCAIQKDEPQFQHHFPDWGTTRYWNELTRAIITETARNT